MITNVPAPPQVKTARPTRFGRLSICLAFLAAAALALSGCTASEASSGPEPIKIGVVISLTGASSAVELPATRGLEMAVDEINQAGGVTVDGTSHKIELFVEDAQSDPSVAVAKAHRLASLKGVKILFAGSQSLAGSPLADFAVKSKLLYFAPHTTLESMLGRPGSQLLFRTIPSAASINTPFIPAAADALGLKDGIVSIFPNDETGNLIVDAAQQYFDSAGLDIRNRQLFQTGSTDFAPVFSSVRNSSADGLYVGYQDADVRSLVNQAVTAGNVPTKFITYGAGADAGLEHLHEIDGYAWSSFTREIALSDAPDLTQWVRDYKATTGTETLTSLDSWAISLYDPMFALKAAIEKAGTWDDLDAIADVLHGSCIKAVRTVCWDGDGRASADFDMGVIANGDVKISTIPVTPPSDATMLKGPAS